MTQKIFNKKAAYDYHITDKIEAGIILSGAEVKSVRAGNVSLTDSFVKIKEHEAVLVNAYISPYQKKDATYNPKRDRKLLLHKAEIQHLRGKITTSSLTLVPLRMYNKRNVIKVEVGLAKGKKNWEKREILKKKAIERDIEQTLRENKLKSKS